MEMISFAFCGVGISGTYRGDNSTSDRVVRRAGLNRPSTEATVVFSETRLVFN